MIVSILIQLNVIIHFNNLVKHKDVRPTMTMCLTFHLSMVWQVNIKMIYTYLSSHLPIRGYIDMHSQITCMINNLNKDKERRCDFLMCSVDY